MPEERIYQSQVAPRPVQTGVMRDARDYGAGLGAAIADAGQTAHQLQLRAYRLDRQEMADSEAADFNRKFTQLRADMDEAVRTARANHGPGAKGHAKAIAEQLEKQRESLFSGIAEDSVKRGAEAQFADFAQRLGKAEGDFEEGRRVDKLVTDIGDGIDISRNRVRTGKGDTETYAEELAQQVVGIDALQGVSDDIKDKLVKQAEQGLTVSYLQGLMDVRPADAKAAIEAGQFNKMLSPEQLEQLKNGADVEIRRIEAEQERILRNKEEQLNSRFNEAKIRAGNGEYIPDEVWAEFEAAYALLGKGDKVADAQGNRSDANFAKIYENATPIEIERRIAELRANGKRTAAEDRELRWMEKTGQSKAATWENDPFAANQAATKSTAPELIAGDPASYRARSQWQSAAYRTTNVDPGFFSKSEISRLQERYRAGEGAQMELLAELDAVPADGGTRVQAARQIAPGDQQFQILAQLNPDSRAMVSEGRKVLRDRGVKTFWALKDNPDVDEMSKQIDQDLRLAMKRLPGAVGPINDVANQFAAGVLARRGLDGSALTRPIYLQAMRVALGGRSNKGGIGGLGYWSDRPYIVDDRYTENDFETALVNDIARQSNAGNPPINPDGSATKLSRAVPVFVGPGRYQWETPGGQLVLAKDGRPFTSVIGPRK
jgi:hypothetical protein